MSVPPHLPLSAWGLILLASAAMRKAREKASFSPSCQKKQASGLILSGIAVFRNRKKKELIKQPTSFLSIWQREIGDGGNGCVMGRVRTNWPECVCVCVFERA